MRTITDGVGNRGSIHFMQPCRKLTTLHNDPVGNGSGCRPNLRSPDEHVGQIDHIDSQGQETQEEQENNRLRVADNDPPEFDYPEVELIRTYMAASRPNPTAKR